LAEQILRERCSVVIHSFEGLEIMTSIFWKGDAIMKGRGFQKMKVFTGAQDAFTYFFRDNVTGGSVVRLRRPLIAALVTFLVCGGLMAPATAGVVCTENVTANVVVLDNPTVFNRLGAQNPNWITYALKRDVVHASGPNEGVPCRLPDGTETGCQAGNVMLRPDKRTRPLVVRSVAGACLTVHFENLLADVANPNNFIDNPLSITDNVLINNDQVAGRCAGFHASGVELRSVGGGIANDGSMVGNNHPGDDVANNCGLNDGLKGSLVSPGDNTTYYLYTPREGAFVINSYGATLGSEANSGNLGIGMFGQLNVEPAGSRIYRSQVTEEELRLATVGTVPTDCVGTDVVGVECNPGGQPIIDYEAVYPAEIDVFPVAVTNAEAVAGATFVSIGQDPTALPFPFPASGFITITSVPADNVNTVSYTDSATGFNVSALDNTFPAGSTVQLTNGGGVPVSVTIDSIWTAEGKGGLPILNMIHNGELVHSDINAIIVGSNSNGTFDNTTYPLESTNTANVPSYPNRLEPFREFTSVFHDEQTNSQVFPLWYNNPVLNYTLAGVKDQFMINYGSGGIGSEIIANRLHTGPMHDCTDCAYEEFFLSSSTVGDPALLVNFPANTGIEQCDPTEIVVFDSPNVPAAIQPCWRDPVNLANGPIPGNYALFQEDPSNVHHSYTGDFVKIRNTHAGAFEQHIFHLHNHQWLHNPNDDNANYLDAQEIMPGSGHTYELVNGGAGNRNKTAGDAIFHCHFYPHFAQGMWYHIRIMDVFERGTVLDVSGADDPQNPSLFDELNPLANFHAELFALRSGKPAAGARALPDGELPDGVPIPAIVPLPGKPMPQMPAKVEIVAVDRGGHSLLGGRTVGPDGVPDSAQVVVDRASVAGADTVLGTPDDVSPGYPFWLAGNECGPGGDVATGACPQGIVGQRMPTPPLDMLTEAGATAEGYEPAQAGGWDGGLPRHSLLGYVSGGLSADTNSRLDFRKVVELAKPVYYPEIGTDLEQVSMQYHSVRERPSAANNLADNNTIPGNFVLNGAPPVPAGPFNDPCIDDVGTPLTAGELGYWFDGDGLNDPTNPNTLTTRGRSNFHGDNPRTYKIANVQIDAVFNKVGYHYPQERIIALWEDVAPTIDKLRPPEPMTMRFNTFDCGKILHANLVPHEFELDDFQVRTPTDIIGQHIHLPKWDLTTGDGAANGWNYEDGTLAPGIVRERIHAINEFNHLAGTVVPTGTLPGQLAPIDLTDQAPVPTLTVFEGADPGSPSITNRSFPTDNLVAAPHPFFQTGLGGECDSENPGEYCGARTTIQRILIDPVVNVAGVDRGLGLTFSHDHYGPSTFQQIGLYSTILAEPAGSTWVHNESGDQVGLAPDGTNPSGRIDGGPTSWQAAIWTPDAAPLDSTVGSEDIPDHREFYFQMSDFQHAYEAGTYVGADATGRPVLTAINQPDPFDATVADAPALHDTWQHTVNPPLKLKSVPFPDVVTAEGRCPGPAGNADNNVRRPCAEAINISHSSMWVVNYRNEPVGLRVFDNNTLGPDGRNGTQTAGRAGDLAFALHTREDRAIPDLNTSFGNTPVGWQNAPYCQGDDGDLINCDRNPGDPFTPIMRTYERDQVKIKIQVGATEEQHQATVHGMKWLSNSSGFGRSPNSGWRNFQSHGISEQFSLQVPVNPDRGQTGSTVDYLYATNATRDGFWSGTWGILRSYGTPRNDLVELPDNPQGGNPQIVNATDFNGVCPQFVLDENGDRVDPPGRARDIPIIPVEYDVTAVLANDVLQNTLGVTIPQLADVDPQFPTTTFGQQTVGGALDNTGGTLVYNRRGTVVDNVLVPPLRGGAGPLNDPTAILYVRTNELTFDTNCFDAVTGTDTCRTVFGDPNGLQPETPVEPLILRANAGDCIEVTLRNALPFTPVINDNVLSPTFGQVIDRVPDPMPDLAGWQDMFWVVNRDLFNPVRPPEMHFFNNNLVRPSSYVGLHPQLVEYDASRHDGVLVGGNAPGQALVEPGSQKTVRWYAGDLRHERVLGGNPNQRRFRIIPTPVEFGGTNLLAADRVKQPQKGLFGALVIEPEGATYPDTLAELQAAGEFVPDGQGIGDTVRLTRAQVTVDATANPGGAGSGGSYREALLIGHKIANIRWQDGTAIANLNQGELGREGAEDSGHAGFNYGMEPSWFRFGLPPDAGNGNAGTANSFGSIPNVHAFYANGLVDNVVEHPNTIPAIPGVSELGDPVTPVFWNMVDPGNPVFDTRMYVLNGASADRDGTFILHGHVWQRDPYVCPGQNDGLGPLMDGRCDNNEPVPSQALGLNPQAKYMGGEEGMGHVYGHWPILFNAGGTDGVAGDYLFRDYAPNGNRNGQFGILRVIPPAEAVEAVSKGPQGQGSKKKTR
jgi:hypothetical protein